MPAVSKKQQKFMGIVRSIQTGDADSKNFTPRVQAVAKNMKKKDVKDFASTKHKGLPMKKEMLDKLKEMVRVELESCGYTHSVSGKKLKSSGGTGPEDRHLKEMSDKSKKIIDKLGKKEKEMFLTMVDMMGFDQVMADYKRDKKAFKQALKDMSENINEKKKMFPPKKMTPKQAKEYKKFIGYAKMGVEYQIDMSLFESINEARLDPKQLLQQLGGNRFIMMVGAKNLVVDKSKNELHMKIGRNSKGVSHVRIRLSSMDLYDMEFLQVRAGKIKIKSKEKGVYADQLGKMFKKNTGMNVRL